MCVEVWNIHQFYEYCTNYPLHHQEEIYIYIMWNIHQFHEYCTKYLTHQEEKIYIMSDEVENIHQFYEYCTNYPLQEEIKKYYVCWSLKYSPILWILHQLSSPPRRKYIYPNSGEVGNINQFHEYCTNYLPHQEERIYIQMVVKLAIFTNSMNIAPIIFSTRKIYIYIMSGEVWNIHQFYEYCTNYPPHQPTIFLTRKEYMYILWVVKYKIFTNSMNIASIIFPTRKK